MKNQLFPKGSKKDDTNKYKAKGKKICDDTILVNIISYVQENI